jgi:septum site-determining protein MinD
MREVMGTNVIMVASGKGGTGKSTLAVLLGAELAARGKRVLLVELDCGMRSVDYIAGVCGKTVYDIEDVLTGRCEAGKAIVESPVYRDLYLISAPYSGGRIRPAALRVFVEKAGPVFDMILLDTAAGMGAPFEAAMAVASRALLVLTPDPAATRDGRIVCDALAAGGCAEIRLLLNQVPPTLENCGVRNLDECINAVGAQLIGVVPYSDEIRRAGATGTPLSAKGRPRLVLRAIAARLCGRNIPLVIR